MGLLQELMKHKEEFYYIFDQAIIEDGDDMTHGGKYSYDDLIESHLRAWIASRIHGGSASMVFYLEKPEAIKLIDKLAKNYFG